MNDALPENVRDMDAAEEAPVNQADLQGFLFKKNFSIVSNSSFDQFFRFIYEKNH